MFSFVEKGEVFPPRYLAHFVIISSSCASLLRPTWKTYQQTHNVPVNISTKNDEGIKELFIPPLHIQW